MAACRAARRPDVVQRGLRMPDAIHQSAVAFAAAALLSTAPLPAIADTPMLSSSEATAAAKPLTRQTVQKDKVWLLLAGGSATLFGATVALERSKVFPAIAKANEAMSVSKAAREADLQQQQQQRQQQQQQTLEVQPDYSSWADENVSTDAVLQGLQSASRRVLSDNGAAYSKPTDADSEAQPQKSLESVADRSDAESLPTQHASTASSPPLAKVTAKTSTECREASSSTSSSSDFHADAAAAGGSFPSNMQQSVSDAEEALPNADSVSTKEAPSAAAVAHSTAPQLSGLSSAELEKLIAAKQQQQQQQQQQEQQEEASAERRQEQPTGKDLADLSEDELQTLIASKRKMALNVVKTVVDP